MSLLAARSKRACRGECVRRGGGRGVAAEQQGCRAMPGRGCRAAQQGCQRSVTCASSDADRLRCCHPGRPVCTRSTDVIDRLFKRSKSGALKLVAKKPVVLVRAAACLCIAARHWQHALQHAGQTHAACREGACGQGRCMQHALQHAGETHEREESAHRLVYRAAARYAGAGHRLGRALARQGASRAWRGIRGAAGAALD